MISNIKDIKVSYIELDNKNYRIYNIYTDNKEYKFPSVTSIFGINENKGINIWKRKEKNWQEISDFATTIGTFCHWRIQFDLAKSWDIKTPLLDFNSNQSKQFKEWYNKFPYNKNTEIEISIHNSIQKIMKYYNDWKWLYNPQFPITIKNNIQSEANIYPFEIKIYSEKYGYAGSIDVICSLMNNNIKHNCLVDIKTSIIHDQYYLQLMAYKIAFDDLYPHIPLDEFRILCIPKDIDKYKYYKFDTIPDLNMKLYKFRWFNQLADFWEKYEYEPEFKSSAEYYLNNIYKILEGDEFTNINE